MIQRPQTVYLIIAAILNLTVFFNSIYSQAMADPAEWIGYGLAISLTLSLLIALGSVFVYKNRPVQLKIVKIATYIQIVALGFGSGVLFSLGGFGTFLWQETIGIALITVALAMYWLAGRGIKKDEELVKSMDRIR
ncbi:DUF4293 domain-containing protein [Rhodohalobacter sulfatireducens]|uniref:DUF4293 domain-containing protein n=1 Tax=Rhodohalobacter sulfatireducens TaxID=2911366 RepID=A0ABS9KA16_9BACT|nr:DUF4293 domain-containing protein [Rhodohalobacter sulfatireducens]MCG2587694.1 DUF4293 domain-containing protein [Rhodohalobacter sulfatireducens]MDR9365529.1 DUF4293 domain-containing protein [Balneolaceae bacterium]MDR9407669.1 DUF4293 domain-containing protein [Balneolaceae bacterium]